ncbi:enoyl-CoA hydratase/isomerase family protein [Amycolatopsis pithecellobii]|uniref:Enoyl-CoA hydratase/isomerase family protein n=1 Tax=Amycolatopsis pithecellobii TaxID=664692 RepID=A0A6N7Z4N2_9PSEU|nr:enoyl-CoA hydratase/isomerase family protein [Amycolatopsis pithecellobii]MTD55451.1 enoyl-CoA hydratase/isomerase family protein [Amycolatopsis pithecellobii]
MSVAAYRSEFDAFTFSNPREGVLQVDLTAPNGNEINSAFHKQLTRLWPAISQDDDVEVVLIAGSGDTFSRGASADLIEAMVDDPQVRTRTMIEARDIVMNVLNFDKPLVSVIQGMASGPALAVALLADISVASDTATLRDGHNAHGVAAGDHAAICWPLLCGMARAKYYLLTSEPVTGPKAEQIGLVSVCAPDGEALTRGVDLAGRLVSKTPNSIRWTKHTLNHWYRGMYPVFDASLVYEIYGFVQKSEPHA